MKITHALRTFLLGSTLLAATSTLHAADGTWNVDANGLWGTASNWTPGIADGSGFTANFTNDITADRTVSLDGDRTLTNVVFGDSDTSSAGSWLLNNNGNNNNNLILAGTTPGITVNALGTGKTATISAIIQGSAGLVKSGDGTLILSGANTYTGNLTVDGGTLIGTVAGAFGSFSGARTINVNSGGILDYGASNMGGGHTATNMNLVITGGTVTNSGTSTFNSLNNVTLTGGTLTSTTGIAGGAQDWGAWIINGTVTSTGTSLIEGAATSGRHIRLNANANNTNFDVQSGTLTVSAPIKNGRTGSNPFPERTSTLTKLGSGTMIISGVSAYTGTTTVSAGKLTISSTGQLSSDVTNGVTIGTASTAATSEFNYNSLTALAKSVSFAAGSTGGTLSGSGTITPTVTITSGNTLAIGNSVGTMNFGTNLNLAGTTLMEIDGPNPTGQNDFANVTGTLTYGGTMTLDIGMIFGVGTYTWNLFDFAGGALGTFNAGGITLADNYSGTLLDADLNGIWDLTSGSNTWQFTESTGVLGLTVVPEPSAALLGSLGMLALLRRRRN
jgi:autotransporter-associated beta strand protein